MTKIDPAYAKQYFLDRGYSDVAASAIVGGLKTESGLNTGAINPGDGADGSNSIGIAQWNGSRARNLISFAQNNNLDVNSADAQLGFLDWELRNDPSASGNAFQYLQSAGNPFEATSAFLRYERPAGFSASDPTAAFSFGKRLNNTIAAQNIDGSGFTWTDATTQPPTGTDLGTIHAPSGDPTQVPDQSGSTGSIAYAIGHNLTNAVTESTSTAVKQAVETATGISTSFFDSLKDYFGRFVFIIVGLILLGGAIYMFSKSDGKSLPAAT